MPKKLTTEEFINRARQIHGDKYDYSKVEYNGRQNEVTITCPTHGEIKITPQKHLEGCGCDLCSKTRIKTTDEFIRRAKLTHGDKYDYSKSRYTLAHEKIIITCPIHGEFKQDAAAHIHGQGCPKCVGKNKTLEEWIREAKRVHGDKYDYSKVNYISNNIEVCIICPKHGEFWQKPKKHICARQNCPKCNMSKSEEAVLNELEKHNIPHKYQATSKNLKWLKKLTLDFYLPTYNVAIECQGIQHFVPTEYFGGDEAFKDTNKRDKLKKELCEKNGVKLLYYTDLNDYDMFLNEHLIKNEEELINVLK